MQLSPAARVLESVDLMTQILGRPEQGRSIARLSSVSKRIKLSVQSATQYTLSPRTFLRLFFSDDALAGVYDLLRRGAIFTGLGTLQFLSGNVDVSTVVLLVPADALVVTNALLAAQGHEIVHEVPAEDIYDAGHDSSEELQFCPYVRQVCYRRQNRIVWVCVPRYNVLYGVLHQRTTLYMHGLCAYGFFSLYPAAAFTSRIGLITHGPIPWRLPAHSTSVPYRGFGLKGYRVHVEGVSKFHRPFLCGPRIFGDSMCWLLPNPFLGFAADANAFAALRGNSWSLNYYRGRWDLAPRERSQKMICTRVVSSILLRQQYLATAACKAFLCGVFHALEGEIDLSLRLDDQVAQLVKCFDENETVYITIEDRVYSFRL